MCLTAEKSIGHCWFKLKWRCMLRMGTAINASMMCHLVCVWLLLESTSGHWAGSSCEKPAHELHQAAKIAWAVTIASLGYFWLSLHGSAKLSQAPATLTCSNPRRSNNKSQQGRKKLNLLLVPRWSNDKSRDDMWLGTKKKHRRKYLSTEEKSWDT